MRSNWMFLSRKRHVRWNARLDELYGTQDNDEEQKEIFVAANALLALKVARRKWEKQLPN